MFLFAYGLKLPSWFSSRLSPR